MNATVLDDVTELLAVIGANSDRSAPILVIDRFDHWSNPSSDHAITLCQCFTSDDEATA